MKDKTSDEIWITIKQNENYEISNTGKVRNKKTKRILKPWKNSRGYLIITLRNGYKSKCHTVHRLVAENFILNPNNLPQVNHIDGNKQNNFINNLEWVSASENMKHAYKNNLCTIDKNKMMNMTEQSKTKTKKIIIQYDLNRNKINEYKSLKEAELKTKIKYQYISSCCRGISKTAGGFIWEYKQ